MRQVWAIARLTFQEGVRMKIVLVFLVVLIFLIFRLPFALRGDETVAGRLQNFLAYALGAVSVLLSLTTIFFSCATLSGELRTRSLQMVVVKPIARIRILLGKWVGVNLLNLAVLLPSAAAIYGFGVFIRNQPEQFVRDRLNIRDVVWTARVAARPTPPDFRAIAEQHVNARIQSGGLEAQQRLEALQQAIEELRSRWLAVLPGSINPYYFENLSPPEREDSVIQVRFKVRAIPIPFDEIVAIDWSFADPQTEQLLAPFRRTEDRIYDAHQFLVSAGRVVADGRALLLVGNPSSYENPTILHFQGDDALQILYKVGSFEGNYARNVLLAFLRLSFLSALGIFFSVFLSFPVACLGTFTFFLLGLGMPWWLDSIGAGPDPVPESVDPYGRFGPLVRPLLVPFLTYTFPDFVKLDGTSALIDGEYIPPERVLYGALHTMIYGALLLLVPGWLIFTRREVADVDE